MANFKDTGKVGAAWGYLVVLPLVAAVAIPMWIAVQAFMGTPPAMPKIEAPTIEESWFSPNTWGLQESAETAAVLAQAGASQAVASSYNSTLSAMSLTAVAVTVAAVLGGVWVVAALMTPSGRRNSLNTPSQQDHLEARQDGSEVADMLRNYWVARGIPRPDLDGEDLAIAESILRSQARVDRKAGRRSRIVDAEVIASRQSEKPEVSTSGKSEGQHDLAREEEGVS
jgi:hypothetical protein